MCNVTSIYGWIKTCTDKDEIQRILKNLKYDKQFIDMFCSPKDTGNRGVNFVFFGAQIDLGIKEPPYLYEYWLKRFEKLIKKLRAHEAFVLVEYSHFDVFAIGYCLVDKKYIKEKINLYKLLSDEDRIEEEIEDIGYNFPLIFTTLKILMKKISKTKRVKGRIE